MILPKSRRWIPFCLTLALLSQGAVMGEGVITQVPSLVHRTEGQSVTLNCTVRDTSAGAARWSRDTGRGRQPFFNTGGGASDPRVTFILDNHLTDKSIRIDNLTLGDSGVYYCDKYRPGPSSEIAVRGPGMNLTVTDSTRESETQPSVIVVSVVTVGVILVLLVAMVVWRCSHHQKTGGQKGDVRPEDAIKHTSTEDAEVTDSWQLF
nr:PREDICTED: tyrosine-protein phosphatase non-receptor type substrate 1-like [Lepisosteus oculatus]